jgi:hypothetical protein
VGKSRDNKPLIKKNKINTNKQAASRNSGWGGDE